MNVKEIAHEIINSPKVATIVVGSTAGTGAGSILDWIPDDIGKLAVLISIILSMVLIPVHLVKLKKERLELKILKQKSANQRED